MPVDSIPPEDLLNFLRNRALFEDIGDDDLKAIAARMEEYTLPESRDLFHHEDAGYTFYIIFKGRVRIWRTEGGQEIEFGFMEDGDKFGEESLIYRRPRSATVSTLTNTHFLTLDTGAFNWMTKNHPVIKSRLHHIAESHRTQRQENFEWLGKGETIHLIAQRHSFELIEDLWKPALVAFLGPFIAFLGYLAPTDIVYQTLFYIGIAFLVIGVIWFVWEFFDWRNDYFIITNQRVVWLEKVAFVSESRQESPLSAIQSINVSTNQWGRSFGFGDIDIRTRTDTGSLHLDTVDDPEHFKRQIEELIVRVRGKSQSARTDSMRHSIRQSLGMQSEAVDTSVGLLNPSENKERGLGFTTRQVESDVIIYHKHPWVLFTKIGFPVLSAISIVIAILYFFIRDLRTPEPVFPSGNFALGIGAPVLFILALFIWYLYADWANDLYQISHDTIIDREKKPFGKENTSSAPLEHVEGITYTREGLINILFNMGDVHIIIAEETLTFDHVHHPSHVQQDIFYRLERLKHNEEEARRANESEAMLGWLKMYHDVIQDEGVDPDADSDEENPPEEAEGNG